MHQSVNNLAFNMVGYLCIMITSIYHIKEVAVMLPNCGSLCSINIGVFSCPNISLESPPLALAVLGAITAMASQSVLAHSSIAQDCQDAAKLANLPLSSAVFVEEVDPATHTYVGTNPAGELIIGSKAADVITGTDGNDVICGGGGNDTIHGLGGNDIIFGGKGADDVDGGDDNDTISGGNGPDTIGLVAMAMMI